MGFLLVLFVLVCSFNVQCDGQVTTRYRSNTAISRHIIKSSRILCCRANTKEGNFHLNGMMNLYDQFDENDKINLLVHPDRNEQRLRFLQDIRKQRVFVAIDTTTNKVIAFLKLFIVPQEEMTPIFDDELHIMQRPTAIMASFEGDADDVPIYDPVKTGTYNLPFLFDAFQEEPYENIKAAKIRYEQDGNLHFKHAADNIYLYCGSLYVNPLYRGCGTMTKVEETAFGTLLMDVLAKLKGPPYPCLYYTYGMVAKKNMHMSGRLRAFASFAQRVRAELTLPLDLRGIPINAFRFPTIKPDLSGRDGRKGYGFLLEYNLGVNNFTPISTPRPTPPASPGGGPSMPKLVLGGMDVEGNEVD